ncbi:hypothetical protein PtB15_14B313 [Puccinia triticina]|nr:hypothetical protein PtB15_14B313 [Puccinia triticina]
MAPNDPNSTILPRQDVINNLVKEQTDVGLGWRETYDLTRIDNDLDSLTIKAGCFSVTYQEVCSPTLVRKNRQIDEDDVTLSQPAPPKERRDTNLQTLRPALFQATVLVNWTLPAECLANHSCRRHFCSCPALAETPEAFEDTSLGTDAQRLQFKNNSEASGWAALK